MFKKDMLLWFSLTFVVIMLALALLAPWVTHLDPNQIDLSQKLQAPSPKHWLGTDNLGRDLWTRLLYGARTSLFLGMGLTLLILVLGASLAFLAAFYQGMLDDMVTLFCTLFLALPSEMLTLMIIALIGPNTLGLVLAITLAKLPWYIQMVKEDSKRILARDYMAFSRLVGRSKWWQLCHHLLPNLANTFIVYATMDMAALIVSIASLSFLGVGVQAPTAEWGRMLSEAGQSAVSYPWQMMPAGLAIFLITVTLNYIGDSFASLVVSA